MNPEPPLHPALCRHHDLNPNASKRAAAAADSVVRLQQLAPVFRVRRAAIGALAAAQVVWLSLPRRTMAAMVELLLRREPLLPVRCYDVSGKESSPWMSRWLAGVGSGSGAICYHYHEDRMPTHGYEPFPGRSPDRRSSHWHRNEAGRVTSVSEPSPSRRLSSSLLSRWLKLRLSLAATCPLNIH